MCVWGKKRGIFANISTDRKGGWNTVVHMLGHRSDTQLFGAKIALLSSPKLDGTLVWREKIVESLHQIEQTNRQSGTEGDTSASKCSINEWDTKDSNQTGKGRKDRGSRVCESEQRERHDSQQTVGCVVDSRTQLNSLLLLLVSSHVFHSSRLGSCGTWAANHSVLLFPVLHDCKQQE